MGTRDGTPCASNPESLGPFALLLNAATVSPAAATPLPTFARNASTAHESQPRESGIAHPQYARSMETESGRIVHERLPPVRHLAEIRVPKRTPSPEATQYIDRSPRAIAPPTYRRIPNAPTTVPSPRPAHYAYPSTDYSPLAMLSAAAEHRTGVPARQPVYSHHPQPLYPPVYHPQQLRTYVSPPPPSLQSQHPYPLHHAEIPRASSVTHAQHHHGVQAYGSLDVKRVPPFSRMSLPLARSVYEPHYAHEPMVNGAVRYSYDGRQPERIRRPAETVMPPQKLPTPSSILANTPPSSTPPPVRLSDVVAQEKVRRDENYKTGERTSTGERISDMVTEQRKSENVVKPKPEKPEPRVGVAIEAPKGLEGGSTRGKSETEAIVDTKKDKVPVNHEIEPEVNYISDSSPQEEEESGEETICPCSSTANVGFMIACDDCDTWQHGKCMGYRRRSDAPEKYYCHLCRPGAVRKGSKAHSLIASKREDYDRQLKNVETAELRRKLAHALVQRESKKWKSKKDLWVSHVVKAFAGLLRSHFKGERSAVVMGLSSVLNLSESDTDNKLRYASRRLRRSGSRTQKQANAVANGHQRSSRSPGKPDENTSRKPLDSVKDVPQIPAGRLRGRGPRIQDSGIQRRSIQSRRDDDSAREDDFDVAVEKPSPKKEERKPRRSSGGHLSREERKIQQIMKQFERLEKQKHRRRQGNGNPPSTPRSSRQDTETCSAENMGKSSKGDKKERGTRPQETKDLEQTYEQRELGDSAMDGEKSDVPTVSLLSTRKSATASPRIEVAQVDKLSTLDKVANESSNCDSLSFRIEGDVGHVSEGDFDDEKPLLELASKRRRSEVAKALKPMINYRASQSETQEKERLSEKECDSASFSTMSAYESDMELCRRPFKRPRLSLCIPSPGPSVLGSPLIPETLRSPLADQGKSEKRPRLLDRKRRLLRTMSSHELPTKKKLILSSLSPRKNLGEQSISPSSLPSCMASKEVNGLAVGMMLVNVDKELDNGNICQKGSSKAGDVKSPWTAGSSKFQPFHDVEESERKQNFSTSTCSSPEKEQCETSKNSVDARYSCLKKRPRLRMEVKENLSPVAAERPNTPIQNLSLPALKSPRPAMLLGFRSVPAPSPGRKTPTLRSVPLKSSPPLSTPARTLSVAPGFTRSRFTASGSGVEPTIFKSTGRSNFRYGSLPKKARLLSPEVKTTKMSSREDDRDMLRGVSPLRIESGHSEEGSADITKEVPRNFESKRGCKMVEPTLPKTTSSSLRDTTEKNDTSVISPCSRSVPRAATRKTGEVSQPSNSTVESSANVMSSESTAVPGGGDEHLATDSTSPSDILQTRMRRFLNRAPDNKQANENPTPQKLKQMELKSEPTHSVKPAAVPSGVQDLRKTIDNNRQALHGRRHGPGFSRSFGHNRYNAPSGSWTNGYHSYHRGKLGWNSVNGGQNGGQNRYGPGIGDNKLGRSNFIKGPSQFSRGSYQNGSMSSGRNWRNIRRFGNNASDSVPNGNGASGAPNSRPQAGNLRGAGGVSSNGMRGRFGPVGPVGPANWRNFREHNGWVGSSKGRNFGQGNDLNGAKSVRP